MQPPIKRIGRYQVIDKLAEGGIAEIFRAKDQAGGVVVIKRLKPEAVTDSDFIERFLGEIDLCRRFFHDNLIRALDFGEDRGSYYGVFEYLPGCNLEFILQRAREGKGPVAVGVALFIVDQLLAGLSYAHAARSATGQPLGIVHRDVTPANVFLGANGAIKLGDFGAALIPGLDDKVHGQLTMGKLSYLSPEQCLGEPVDQRGDLFSVAVICAEALGNLRLFAAGPGEATESVMHRIAFDERPNLHAMRPSIPEGLAALIQKGLSRKAKNRFQSAQSMRASLSLFAIPEQSTAAAVASEIARLT